MLRSADLSLDRVYRYDLVREWDREKRQLVWIMLNPSTADAMVDDPTIRRCIAFSKVWGYGALRVLNLYALRATDPAELAKHPDPIGPDNDWHIKTVANSWGGRDVVVAWGTKGGKRAGEVLGLLAKPPMCLGLTKDGHPRHPLYVKGDTKPIPWAPEGGK
jgi:hypothetical protein